MHICVRLTGFQQHNDNASELDLGVPEGKRVGELVTDLGLEAGSVALFIVNNQQVVPDYPLREGDRVELLAVMVGG